MIKTSSVPSVSPSFFYLNRFSPRQTTVLMKKKKEKTQYRYATFVHPSHANKKLENKQKTKRALLSLGWVMLEFVWCVRRNREIVVIITKRGGVNSGYNKRREEEEKKEGRGVKKQNDKQTANKYT